MKESLFVVFESESKILHFQNRYKSLHIIFSEITIIMSINTIKLPKLSDSEDDSSSDIIPISEIKSKNPKIFKETSSLSTNSTPSENINKKDNNIDFTSLGLPILSFDSDPFLSPINELEFTVKRHRIWIKGIKGVKFSLILSNNIILVAKRKMKYLKQTWFISKSLDFSLSTPNLTGILIRQRNLKSFTLLGPQERQIDSFKSVLGGFDLDSNFFLGKNLWISPEKDDIFEENLNEDSFIKLIPINDNYLIPSIKNICFKINNNESFIFKSMKQSDKTLKVIAKGPLSLVQAFGLSISLFMK